MNMPFRFSLEMSDSGSCSKKSGVSRVSMTDFECMRGSPQFEKCTYPKSQPNTKDFGDVASSHPGQLANS